MRIFVPSRALDFAKNWPLRKACRHGADLGEVIEMGVFSPRYLDTKVREKNKEGEGDFQEKYISRGRKRHVGIEISD